MKRIEAGLIDSIAAITPWLAPLIPAYLVYHNMLERLDYSHLFALIGAGAVEFLGLSAVHTAVTFWQWNDTRKVGRAPLWAALVAGLFYVAIVLIVNAVLDIAQGTSSEQYVKILAHALLSLLSVDAAVIIAIRASHARRVMDDANERQRRAEERKAARQAEIDARQAALGASHDATNDAPRDTVTREQFVTLWQSNGHKSISALAQELGVNPRKAQRWVAWGNAYKDGSE